MARDDIVSLSLRSHGHSRVDDEAARMIIQPPEHPSSTHGRRKHQEEVPATRRQWNTHHCDTDHWFSCIVVPCRFARESSISCSTWNSFIRGQWQWPCDRMRRSHSSFSSAIIIIIIIFVFVFVFVILLSSSELLLLVLVLTRLTAER